MSDTTPSTIYPAPGAIQPAFPPAPVDAPANPIQSEPYNPASPTSLPVPGSPAVFSESAPTNLPPPASYVPPPGPSSYVPSTYPASSPSYGPAAVSEALPVGAPPSTMPSWVSHKVVHADRIKTIVHNDQNLPESVVTEGDLTIELPPDIFVRGTPIEGHDFIVQYDDGYLSWSPEAVFEAGYTSGTSIAPAAGLQDIAGNLAPAGSPLAPTPVLGVLVHDLGDGTVGIHAIEPNGTEHAIVMVSHHNALLAFIDTVRKAFTNLGERATSWEKTVVADVTGAPKKPEP